MFFFLFPMMMIGLITAIVVAQVPAWPMKQRVTAVLAVGAVGVGATYLTAIRVHTMPDQPLLLVYEYVLTVVFGGLMVGAAALLKKYFMPVAMTFGLILSVPSSGDVVPPDLLPAPFRYLSEVMPLAQGVNVTRSVAYFHDAGTARPTLLLAAWALVAVALIVSATVSQRSQVNGPRHVAGPEREISYPVHTPVRAGAMTRRPGS